jgi:abortive infection bacteriophage resistance protein
LEVASLGTLSKLYKSLKHQLPEKAAIANEMGLKLHNELSGWLEAIACIRNIIAHHSRLWGSNMIKIPAVSLNNPSGQWLCHPIVPVQSKKPFLIISCMIYLCNQISPGHEIKMKIFDLFNDYPTVPVYKIGFLNQWHTEPLWKEPSEP